MNKTSAKNKIYIGTFLWLMLCGSMFGYLFKILDSANAATVASMSDDQQKLQQLLAEQKSFKQAQKDLQDLQIKPYQPKDFFSKDVTLVNEVEVLETLGNTAKVSFELGGLGGTITSAQPAPTLSGLYSIPVTLSITGDFLHVLGFIEGLENLDFITNANQLSLAAGPKGTINITLGASLYLQK